MNEDYPIYNLWLINKKNSLCVLQKNYSFKTNIDNDLFSGFITAVFNFSEELSGETVRSIAMGSIKLFYKSTDKMILALAANENLNETDIAPVLNEVLTFFKNEGYEKFLDKNVQQIEIFNPFLKTVEQYIKKSTPYLNEKISQNKFLEKKIERLKEDTTQTRFSPLIQAIRIDQSSDLSDEDLQVKKHHIIEAIESAEYALQTRNYQDAIIYWGVAAGLFKDIGQEEKELMCRERVEKLKEKISQPDFDEDVPLISTVDEEEAPILLEIEPVIPFENIDDNKIKATLKKAYEAEIRRKNGEASTYYNSASGLFLINKDFKKAEICSGYAKEILTREQNEVNYAVHIIGGEFPEEKSQEPIPFEDPIEVEPQIMEPTEEISLEVDEISPEISAPQANKDGDLKDNELNQILNNAKLAEELNLFEKAINFYKEIIEKLKFYEDFETAKRFEEKVFTLKAKSEVENHKFLQIIPLEKIRNEKIAKNLALAYDFELKKNFSQANLYYNIVAGLYSIDKEEELSKKCTQRAKELQKFRDYKI